MVRITAGSRRYRTKEQIAEDISFILNAPVQYGTQFAVMSEAMWVWTERDGKYEGCPYWTALAMAMYAVNRKIKRRKHQGLRHEHVVPKRVVMDMLEALKPATPEAVHEICNTFLHAVVVTAEEDAFLNFEFQSTMPPEFYDVNSPDYRDPWLRYKRSNISWFPVAKVRDAIKQHVPHVDLEKAWPDLRPKA